MSEDGKDKMQESNAVRDLVYGSYRQTHGTYSNVQISSNRGRNATNVRILKRVLPKDKSINILDFGCGDGFTLGIAESLGYKNLFGVDYSASLLEIAAERTRATLHCGNGLDYLSTCDDARFDAVIAFDVLEHFQKSELIAVCRQIVRVLTPGGLLLAHVPNGASPYVGKIFWGDATHEQAFTAHSMQQVLRPLGFSEVQSIEDGPVAHGVISSVRALLWNMVKGASAFRLAVETGVFRGHILTLNLFVIAKKAVSGREEALGQK